MCLRNFQRRRFGNMGTLHGMESNRSSDTSTRCCMYTPHSLADAARDVSVEDSLMLWSKAKSSGPLTPQHARELLRVARAVTDWHKLVAILLIGDICFETEFVDFAIDMLTF